MKRVALHEKRCFAETLEHEASCRFDKQLLDDSLAQIEAGYRRLGIRRREAEVLVLDRQRARATKMAGKSSPTAKDNIYNAWLRAERDLYVHFTQIGLIDLPQEES